MKQPEIFWFSVAIIVRTAAMILLHALSLSAGKEGFSSFTTSDDVGYWTSAHSILAGTGNPHRHIYPYFVAGLIKLFGESLLPTKLLNVLLSSGTVWLMVRLMRSSKKGLVPGWRSPVHVVGGFLALSPFSVFMSTQVMKDSLVVFSGSLIAWGILSPNFSKFHKLVAAIAGGLLLLNLRSYAFAAFAISLALFAFVALAIRFIRRDSRWALPPAVAAVIGLFAIAGLASPILSDAAQARGGYEAQSNVGISLETSNPTEFSVNYTHRFATALFGALAWQVDRIQEVLLLLDGLWFLASLAMLLSIGRLSLRVRPMVFVMAGLLLIGFIAFLSDNLGSNARLRLLPHLWILVSLACLTPDSATPNEVV